MPKQSRVKKPSGFQGEVRQRLATLEIQYDQINGNLKNAFERLCKLETNTVNVEDLADGQQIFESRILHKFNELDERQLKYVDAQIQQLNARMGSDFQDQDDEIEKISRRLQSVEDKLKAKQLGEQTNVELTARVKELQRQLTEAKREIDRLTINGTKQPTVRVLDTVRLQCGRIVDSDYVEGLQELLALAQKSTDRVQRELNEAHGKIAELESKLAAERSKVRTIWDIITLKRSK